MSTPSEFLAIIEKHLVVDKSGFVSISSPALVAEYEKYLLTYAKPLEEAKIGANEETIETLAKYWS